MAPTPRQRNPEKTSGLLWLYVAAAVTVALWLFVLSPLLEDMLEPHLTKHKNRWHSGRAGAPASSVAVAGEASVPRGLPADSPYAGATIMIMAGGDTSGRNSVALVQSLRDVGTVLPIIVLLVRGGLGSVACSNQTWKEEMNRTEIRCGSDQTIAEEIISPPYVHTLRRLGVEIRVLNWLPRTKYTEEVAGGKDSFWGYSLNRLMIFNMTEFKKIIYMDTDTLVLKNIDHLALEPTFTTAYTHSCCNRNDPPRISGGLWILEPDIRVGEYLWKLMIDGRPTLFLNGSVDWSIPMHYWDLSDLDLAMHAFRSYDWRVQGWMFPKVADIRHGIVPGARLLPQFAQMDNESYANLIRNPATGKPYPEGFMPELYDPTKGGGVLGRGVPGVVWRTLGVQYDQCVGNLCECGAGLTGRDIPHISYSVHFSCLQYTHKPGDYKSEYEFLHNLYFKASGCSRHYFLLWYRAYRRAGLRLPEPYWEGPPVPGHNATHDAFVFAWRAANGVRGAFG